MALVLAASSSQQLVGNWSVFRSQTASLLTCKRLTPNGPVLLASTKLDEDAHELIIPTFPPLPSDVLHASCAVLNSTGTLLAIATPASLLLLSLPSSSSSSSHPPAPLKQTCRRDGEWILENSAWKMFGKLKSNGSRFEGVLQGPISLSLSLERRTAYEWVDGDIVFRFDERDGTGRFLGQECLVQRVGDFCAGFAPVDVCFHALLPRSHLVVLDPKSTVRVYNFLASTHAPETQCKLSREGAGEDMAVCKIAFVDNCNEFWPLIALYALRRDGSILAVSPIARASSLAGRTPSPNYEQQQLNAAQREFLKQASAGGGEGAAAPASPQPLVQVLDLAPKCPSIRYATGEQVQQGGAHAVDFKLTKLEDGEGGMMIHRTWSCGRMDVLFAPEIVAADPAFAVSKLALLLSKEASGGSGSGGGPFRLLRAKIKTTSMDEQQLILAEQQASVNEGSVRYVRNRECLELVRCVDMFAPQTTGPSKSREPKLLPIHFHPLCFLLLDAQSGEPVLFRATWAAPNTSNSNADLPQIDATRLQTMVAATTLGVQIPAIFSDASVGVGLSFANSQRVDLTSRLRYLGKHSFYAAAAAAALRRQDQDESKSVSDSHDFAQYRKDLESANTLFENLQAALNSFPQTPIPLEFSNQALDSLDEDTAFAAATWLSDNFNWSANAPDSLVSRLMDSDGKLALAAEQQQVLFKQMQDEVVQWKQTFEFMEDERKEMERDIVDLKIILVEMQLAAKRCLQRTARLRAFSPQEVSFLHRLRGLRADCERLDAQWNAAMQHAQVVLQSLANKPVLLNLSDAEAEDDVRLPQDSDALERASWMWRRAFDLADEAFVLAHHLPPTHARTFLVYCNGQSDSVPLQQDCLAAALALRPIKVHLSQALLARSQQQIWRREFRLLHVPHNTVKDDDNDLRIVLIPAGEEFIAYRKRDFGLELVIELRLAGESLADVKYTQVSPVHFVARKGEEDERAMGIFAHVQTKGDTLNPMLQRLASDRLQAL